VDDLVAARPGLRPNVDLARSGGPRGGRRTRWRSTASDRTDSTLNGTTGQEPPEPDFQAPYQG